MLSSLLSAIAAPPADAFAEAQRHLDSLTKPPGSLGRLEEIAARLAVLRGGTPRVERPVVFTFAADHGVVAEGVSAYPQVVTAQMVDNFLRGGAAINVLARQAGARVVVADFGVAGALPPARGLVSRRIAAGTANMARGPWCSTGSSRPRPASSPRRSSPRYATGCSPRIARPSPATAWHSIGSVSCRIWICRCGSARAPARRCSSISPARRR